MYQRLKHKRKELCALSPAAVIELETDEVEQSGTSQFTGNSQFMARIYWVKISTL